MAPSAAASVSSEDAVTWVVFTYLKRSKLLLKALQNVQLVAPDASDIIEPTLLLWGVPVEPNTSGTSLRAKLSAHCAALGEDQQRMSEPDVIVDLGGHGIVSIEVKHLSGHDKQTSAYAGWGKYESTGTLSWKFSDVKESGCYELARNWCLLKRLSDGRSGSLANLGPSDLFKGPEGARLDRFVTALGADDGLQFRKVTWDQLLEPFLPTAPDWFSTYCRHKPRLLS